MNMPIADLERRVHRLEASVRVLSVACVMFIGLAVVAAQSADPPDDLIQAQRIQLVDAAGMVWMDLRHDSTETGLFIQDGEGDTRIGVAQFAHGGGGFALHGPRTRGAAVLYLRGDGHLSFYDAAGTLTSRFPER